MSLCAQTATLCRSEEVARWRFVVSGKVVVAVGPSAGASEASEVEATFPM